MPKKKTLTVSEDTKGRLSLGPVRNEVAAFDAAVAFAKSWGERVQRGWDGKGPSPEVPDRLDEMGAAQLLADLARLRDLVATSPDISEAILLAYSVGQRAGVLGREGRLRKGHLRVEQELDWSKRGVESRRDEWRAESAELRADVHRYLRNDPSMSFRAIARALLSTHGREGDGAKAHAALSRRIARLAKTF